MSLAVIGYLSFALFAVAITYGLAVVKSKKEHR